MIKNPYKYSFIAIEGIDGCGKSTLIEKIQKWDEENGIGAIFTKEQTNGDWGQLISMLLRNHGFDIRGDKVQPSQLQEFYILDRLEHRQNEAGFLEMYPIFSDRDFLSTIAYGLASGVSHRWVLRRHEEELGEYFFAPDLVIILDLPAEEAVKRMEKAGKEADFFEKLNFLKLVRDAYLVCSRFIEEIYPRVDINIVVINALQSPEKVFEDAIYWINRCFQDKSGMAEYIRIFKNISYCRCPNPIRVITSPIDTVDTCKYCGKIIKN